MGKKTFSTAAVRPTSSTSRARVWMMAGVPAIVASILAPSAHATTYTYTGATTGTLNWNSGSATQWNSNLTQPVSAVDTTLQFSNALTAALTLGNNLGTFNLTALNDTHGGAFVLTLNGNALAFTGTTNTISLASGGNDVIANNISFTNSLTITTGQFVGYTISGSISGSGGLIKNGTSSTLRLSVANSYTGGTQINGSTVIVANNAALSTGATSTVLLNAGTLAQGSTNIILANNFQIGGNVGIIDAANVGAGTLGISGTVNLLGATRTLNVGGSSASVATSTNILTLSGVISNGGLVKEGRGVLILSGSSANTYTGGTVINNGTMQFNTAASLPTTGSITLNDGGALNATGAFSNVTNWLNSGRITADSNGTIALIGTTSAENIDFTNYANLMLGSSNTTGTTYTGTITPVGGIYRLGGGGGILTLSNTNAITGVGNQLSVGAVLSLGSIGATQIAAQTGSLGTVALSSTNDFSGVTTVNSGVFSLIANGGMNASAITVNNGATLNLNDSLNTGLIGRANRITLNTATLTVTDTGTGTGNAVIGAITTGHGLSTVTLSPTGGGQGALNALTLSRSTGAEILVRGVGFGTTGGASHFLLTFVPTFVGTASTSGTTMEIIPWGIGDNSATGNGTDFLTYDNTNGLRRLTSSEYITTFASGNATPDNAEITTAITGINAATNLNSLALGTGASTAGNGTISIASGGILSIGATTSIGTAIDFGTSEGIVTPITGSTLTVTGNVSGSGGLTKNGAGTLTMTSGKAFTGVTTINAGILSTNTLANGGSNSGVGASSNAAANLVLDGGSLTYSGALVNTDRLFSVGTNNGAIISSGTGALNFTNTGAMGFASESGDRILTLSGAGSGSLAAVIGESGGQTSLLKALAGSWTLSGSNTYTGVTSILGDVNNSAGTLVVSSLADGGTASNIGASSNAASNLVINRGVLQYTGSGASTDRLFTLGALGGTLDASGTGALNFTNTGSIAFTGPAARTLTLSGSGLSLSTLSAAIIDSGATAAAHATSLTKTGVGTWQLAGANTYSGTTNVSVGKLLVNGTHTGGGAYAISGTGTLGGTGSITTANNAGVTLSGTGKLAPGVAVGMLTMDLGAGSLNVSAATTGSLQFDLAGIGSSDQIVLAGTTNLNIGSGVLIFSDFAFNDVGGVTTGDYTLIDSSTAITGTLGAIVTGTLAGGNQGTLELGDSGNDLILHVDAVPEPASLSLLGLAAGSLLTRRRRRVFAS